MTENPDRKSVQRLARQLLAAATACPALIHRSENASGASKVRSSGPFPAMALLSDPVLDIRQYLEDLVRIAVGSARQAEDMSFEVRKDNRKTRRSMAVVASFGALGLMIGIAAFIASRSANVRLLGFHDEASSLQSMAQDIASQHQQREEEAAFARQKEDQQVMREALQRRITDLQQQASSLQDQVAQRTRDLDAASTETTKLRQHLEAPSPPIPPAKEASAANSRGRLQPDLQQEANPLQSQPARRTHDLVAPGSWIGKQRQNGEAARTQVEPPQQQRKADLTTLRLPSVPPTNPVSPVAQPIPVFMPRSSAAQQLLIARQRLVAGRLDEARRLLTMVQTQMVFQPVDQHASQGVNTLAADVGNAIRWLDRGDNGRAMLALNQAVYNAGAD